MSQIRRSQANTASAMFHVGDLVTTTKALNNMKDLLYPITSYRGKKTIRISGIVNKYAVIGSLLEIVDIRTDQTPSLKVNGVKTYLVRVRKLSNDNLYILPACVLTKVVGDKNEEIPEYADTVRRIHIKIIKHPDQDQPTCKWWMEKRFPVKIASRECQVECPLKLFSKGDYIYCRGTIGDTNKVSFEEVNARFNEY